MTTSHLVFIPAPGAGHLPPTVELAKVLLHHHKHLSVTIIIMKLPFEPENTTQTHHHHLQLRFITIPCQESTNNLNTPKTFVTGFIENQKPHVRTIVRKLLTESAADSVRLVGFVVDMFCVPMIDVANEFEAPTYIYFTSNANVLGLLLYLQAKHDEEGFDVTELKDSEFKLSIPSYINPIPAKVLPTELLDKEGGFETFINIARRFRESKGIIINTFQELQSHGVEYLSSFTANMVPPVFPVGPILNAKNTIDDAKMDEILRWLNEQPETSVVFFCFGSMGCFDEVQVKEIAVAIEKSGHRFLWSLRRPPPKGTMGHPKEYENPEEVLPAGFLERTSEVGKMIGWAPQLAVLSHPSVGGFVSHCGWNSVLESIWCGVPVATWPLYAEQQLNAFELVAEMGIGVEIRMDYRTNMRAGGSEKIVTAEEIESGIRRLMGDGEIRKKVNEMKEKSRLAISEGGSSYISIQRFIHHVML